eukprot:scaffold2601_cov127-Skeletonema_dohrnii-CCMP3373.AAC.3
MSPVATTANHHQRRRRAVIVCSLLSWTCALSTAFSPTHHLPSSVHTSSSSPTPHSPTPSTNHHHSTIRSSTHLQSLFTSSKTKKNSPLEDEPWKKDDSYWDQLQAASKDPEQFEKFIEETMAKKNKVSSSSTSPSLSSAYESAKQEEEEKPKKKKGAYVPIEQWDATRSKDDMTKEERLQWECQRGGNRVRQNEILMHNLKGF